MKRIVVPVLVLAAFVIGLSLQLPAEAQNANLPFSIGDTIQMAPSSICTVHAIKGTFVRCQEGLPTEENWWNLMTVEHLRVVRK
jgi:hypothetical protein